MITFRNKSILPLECIKTFGVSAKENEHPIGYFGTGLKYAIAVLLREGCEIEIIRDGRIHRFDKRKGDIRGKEFEFIYMDGDMLPFTTELGKNWALWQAYRELYSNCMDEQGEVTVDMHSHTGGTEICVTGLHDVHEKRGEFILLSKPKYELEDLEIHESETPGIFYKGIRVLTLPTKFSYNILSDLTLTEDRTAAQWDVSYAITRAITTTDNTDAILDVLTIADNTEYFEPKLDYSKYVTPSAPFMRLVAKLKVKPHNVATYYGHHSEEFVGGLPKEAPNVKMKQKLMQLRELMSFKPKEIYVTKMTEDYKIVKDELCLNAELFRSPKKLSFIYLLACCKMSGKPNRTDAQVIAEDMLKYFVLPKPQVEREKAA